MLTLDDAQELRSESNQQVALLARRCLMALAAHELADTCY